VLLQQQATKQVAEQQLAQQHRCQVAYKGAVVASTHAVADHGAVVVKTLHTAAAGQKEAAYISNHWPGLLVLPCCFQISIPLHHEINNFPPNTVMTTGNYCWVMMQWVLMIGAAT
jgi:hypothetical protein